MGDSRMTNFRTLVVSGLAVQVHVAAAGAETIAASQRQLGGVSAQSVDD